MPNRTDLIKKFLKEGFTYRTLSLFSDKQLTHLSKKLFTEQTSDELSTEEKRLKSALAANLSKQSDLVQKDIGEDKTIEDNTDEELDIETDDTGNPDVEIDGTPLLREKEIEEDFDSKAQQRYLYAVNPAAAEKLASKMTKQDYKNLPEKVNEQEILENWVMSIIEKKEQPEITKANFIKTIKESLSTRKKNIGTQEQNEAFEMVEELATEMTPSMAVIVDDFDDDGHLNGQLQTDDQSISLNICPQGNIKLDGNALGDIELTETDRDDEGEYIGAPESTTAPAPLKTPTIAPSRPGEKKRRGPFERPKTTPKPKARNKNALPDWLKATNLGKSLTQHG